ncbi:MAG: hypothetical protein ACLFTR_00940 [Candidatus Woesearchaeota archaeon]
MNRKSQIWVSAVLYTMVAAISIAFILQAGLPLIEGMRDRSVFNNMKNQMLVLDQHIEQVASEGRGSQRYVPFEISQGEMILDAEGLRWEMETKTKIVEPRSSYKVGNLLISANSDVSAEEKEDHYVLENSLISLSLLKAGSRSDQVEINTSDIIKNVTVLETGNVTEPDISFGISGDDSSSQGIGYTELTRRGTRLGSSSHVTHLEIYKDGLLDYSYELHIILDGEADFVRPEIRNFRSH